MTINRSTSREVLDIFPLGSRMVLFSLAYFGCAVVGSLFSLAPGAFVNFWLPSGLFVGVLLADERRYWPALVLAAIMANLAFDAVCGHGLYLSLLFSLGNCLEALAGAWLVQRFVAERPRLSTLKETGRVLTLAALLSPVLSATVGTSAFALLPGPGIDYWPTWLLWWSGDAFGVLLLLPFILTWNRKFRLSERLRFSAENLDAALMTCVILAMAVFIFWDELHPGLAVKYILIPLLMWVAMRFGVHGVVTANLLVAMTAVWFTANGHSDISLSGLSPYGQTIALQLYLAVVSVTGLFLAIVLAERRQAEMALRENAERLRLSFDQSPLGGIIADLDGSFLQVNAEMARIIGYSQEELLSKTFLEITHPDYLDNNRRLLQSLLEGEIEQYMLDKQYIRKDGSFVWVHVSASLAKDMSGRPLYIFGTIEDITERKKIEAALRGAEQKFRNLAEESPNMIFINKMGRVVFANRLCSHIMKYRPDEFYDTGFDFSTLIAPEQRPLVKKNLRRHMQGEEVPPYEYTLVTKDGERIESIINTSLIDFEGELAILGIITLITDRKRIEVALRESELRYRRLVDSTTDYIYTVKVENGKSVGTTHGPGCVAVTGYTPEDYQADQYLWFQMIHQDDRSAVLEQVAKALAGQTPPPLEHRIMHQDGSLRWLRDTIVLHKDINGMVVSYDGLVTDITERKRAEAEIRRVASVKTATLESTADGILVVDGVGRILDYNDQFVRMWQIPQAVMDSQDDERALGYVLDQLVRPQVFLDKVHQLYNQPQAESFDVLEFKDGRIFERYSRPLKIDQRPEGRVWSFRDVTAQKQVEVALKRAKEQAEAADRIKSEFLTNVSHDFRTPLNAIAGFSAILGEANLDERSRKMLGIIQDKSQSLLSMTGDLLEASGMKSGKTQLRAIPFDFRRLMLDAVEVARLDAANKDLVITCDILNEMPRFLGDPIRAEQVVANLLTNAVKYTERGAITVTVSCSVKPGSPERRMVRVSVKDTGWGIPKEKQGQIFDPFTRFHEFAGGRQNKGVGLGLHIAKTMVNLMGGEISVVSEVGKGSDFVFTLDLLADTHSS